MAHKVIVLGSSGNVGSAVIKSLSSKFPAVSVLAGVRDPSSRKAGELNAPNVTLVKADLSDPASLSAAIPQGVDAVFVNTPGHIDRTKQAINGINAAKAAKAKHVVVVSVLSVPLPGTIFADQFIPIEEAAKSSGVPYTLIRLPIFIENLFAQMQSIKGNGQFYTPANPDALHTPVSVGDIGEFAATVLSNPSKHANQTYKLTSKPHSHNDIAKAFSTALGKPVTFVQVPFDAAKQSFLSLGILEWQADGIIQLYHHINSGEKYYTYSEDFKNVVGRDPTTIEQWTQHVSAAFK